MYLFVEIIFWPKQHKLCLLTATCCYNLSKNINKLKICVKNYIYDYKVIVGQTCWFAYLFVRTKIHLSV